MNEKPKRKIATKLEQAIRIKKIYQWLMSGDTMRQAIEKCEKEFTLRTAQSRILVNKARAVVTKHFESQIHNELSDICTKMGVLYEKNMEKDPSTARQALMDKAKLIGLVRNNVDLTVNSQDEYADTELAILEESATTH